VESDAALLVVEDHDELESRAECFEVVAQRGHAYVVGMLNECSTVSMLSASSRSASDRFV
jgi:hypothetical protein